MTQETGLPKRKNLRLPDYDYSEEGWYFVTIDTYHKIPLFGSLIPDYKKHLNKTRPTPVEDLVRLNEVGRLVQKWWLEIPKHFEGVSLDLFRVMPHHIHGIICINDRMYRMVPAPVGATLVVARQHEPDEHCQRAGTRPAPTNAIALGEIVGFFKSHVTDEYIENVKTKNWPRYNKFFWQRGYFDNIIRNERSLAKIQFYIHYNPEGSITE